MSGFGVRPAGLRVIQIKPWDNSTVTKDNLNLFAGLNTGEKLKKYNHEGRFAKSKAGILQGWGRDDDDSITRLKADIIRVFQEAKKRGLEYQKALDGIRKLRGSYKKKQSKRGEVDEIIKAVENLDKNFAGHAYNAIQHARNQIKWSSNKRYQVPTNMSNKAVNFKIKENLDLNNVTGDQRKHFISKRFKRALRTNENNFFLNKNTLILINQKIRFKIPLTSDEQNLWAEFEFRQLNGSRCFAVDEMASLGVGNCHEMSKLAFKFLARLDVPVSIMSLGQGSSINKNISNVFEGDHVFLLVGHNFHEFDEYGNVIAGPEPWIDFTGVKDLDGVYICDPWANIVCPIQSYPSEWEFKMHKWSRVKKSISSNGAVFDPYEDINYRKCITLCRWRLLDQHFA